MKKIYKSVILLLVLIFSFPTLTACQEATMTEIKRANYNINYDLGRTPWDMILYEDKIYVGAGNYDKNLDNVPVFAYDLKTNSWTQTGILADSEVNRFYNIDGKLVVPGTDPVGSRPGQYFVKDGTNGEWEAITTISDTSNPNGEELVAHTFDIIKYNGVWFAGNGIFLRDGQEAYPVIMSSSDDGNTFAQVEMYKDGLPLVHEMSNGTSTHIRVYDFFVLNDNLYAIYTNSSSTYEVYHYEDGAFVYYADWKGKVARKAINHIKISAKETFNEKMFFTTGYLYSTQDMDNVTRITLPNNETVCDILVSNNALYALAYKKITDEETQKSTYKITVYKTLTGEQDDFTEVFSFEYEINPQCFLKTNDAFYIGMGEKGTYNTKNGNIIKYLNKG